MAERAAISSPNGSTDVRREYVGFLNAALDVISTRVLALLGEFGAIGVWGFTMYDPTPQRVYAALGYSLTVFFPLILLHWRKG